jgi:hypothetical protein
VVLKQSQVPGMVFKRVLDNLPVEIEPSRFTTASGSIPEMTTEKPAIVLSHNPGPRNITTIGSDDTCRRRLRTGNIFLQVRTPAVFGQDTIGVDIAERLSDLFEGYNGHLPVIYSSTDIRVVGRDGAWYLTNCVLTYEFEIVA